MACSFLSANPAGVIIDVWVVSGSSKECLAGLYGDFLKLKVVQPPESGKANKGVCAFFAKLLGVQVNNVELISGNTNRHKRLLIKGLSVEQTAEIIKGNL